MNEFLAAAAKALPVILLIVGLVAAAVLIWLVHRAVRRFTIDRLVYTRAFSEDCVCEGDEAELLETIWNPTPFFVLFVDVESYFYSGLEIDGQRIEKGEMRRLVSRHHLRPFEKITSKIKVVCARRGTYNLTSAMIYRAGGERWIDSAASISVCPKIVDRGRVLQSSFGIGDIVSSKRLVPDPFEIRGVRDYTSTDPFKSINFKTSAHLSVGGAPHIVVNDYEFCSSVRCFVYQNFHLPAYSGISYDEYEELMEDGLKISASIIAKAIDLGGLCSFSANCETLDGKKSISFPAASGEVHKKDILMNMAGIRAADGASFSSILARDISRGVYGSEIYIITAFPDEQTSRAASYFRRLGNNVCVITLGGDGK